MNRNDISVGVDGSMAGQVFEDESSHFQMFIPIKVRNTQTIAEAIVEFVGGRYELKEVGALYNDRARSFLRALKRLLIPANKSTPYTPNSNARMERSMYTIGDSTRVNLLRSGLTITFWPYARTHSCCCNNVVSPKVDMKTPY